LPHAAAILAEAGDVLTSSLDYQATLAAVVHLVVPQLADFCGVYVVGDDGSARQLAVAHVDPTKVELARELARRYPSDPQAPRGVPQVLRSGKPEIVPEITEEMLLRGARDPEHLHLLRRMNLKSYMLVPLCARGRTLGALTFATAESGHHYGPDDLALAEELARRAALAVDNARLYQEAQAALREREVAVARHRHMEEQLTLLVEASTRLSSSLDLEAVSAAVLDLSRRLIAADAHAIWRRREADGIWEVTSSAGLSATYLESAGKIPRPGPVIMDELVIATDVQAAPMLEERHSAYEKEGIRSLLAAPLRIHGSVAGTLVFYYRTPRAFDEVTIRLATALANLAASAIETAELYSEETGLREQAEGAQHRLGFLAAAGSTLAASLDFQTTLERITGLLVPRLADWCIIDLIEEGGAIRQMAVAHADPAMVQLAWELDRRYPDNPQAEVGVPCVIRTGQSKLFPTISDALLEAVARDRVHLEAVRQLGLKSGIIVPLPARGRILGALSLGTAESGRRYGPDDLALAEELARRAALALDNARLYREVQEADRRKDEFLAMLAHELRNPLAPLRNALHILQVKCGRDPVVSQMSTLMGRQINTMVRLVNELLDVSRITRGKIELRKQPVDLREIVQRSVENVRSLLDESGHQLEMVLPARPLRLELDPARLEQILINLLSNAVRYTPAGGRIGLTVEAAETEAVLRVQDSGIGIRPEMLPHVFDLFLQADRLPDRAQEGLGIGLTLVRRLVELHGGKVAAFSNGPGCGSEFVVWLPLGASATASAAAIPVPTAPVLS
jgi:signal transduction histidine kinase